MSRHGNLAGVLVLTGLLLAMPGAVHPQDVAGNATVPSADMSDFNVARALSVEVGAEWGVPWETVRVDMAGDPPAGVDSLHASQGSADRWIVTLWSGDQAVRRFARVGTEQALPVATRAIGRGGEVGALDVRYEPRPVWGCPVGPVVDPVGMVAERVIAEGELLVSPSVRPPLLVRGGDDVEALFAQGGVLMRIRGQALASARAGERIEVRLASGLRMSAFATGPGRVELILGGSR